MDSNEISGLRAEYKLETNRDILPFARRQDNDDIAGFVIQGGVVQKEVYSVHLTWKGKVEQEGYPISKRFDNLFDWVSEVLLVDTIDWISEEEINDLIINKN